MPPYRHTTDDKTTPHDLGANSLHLVPASNTLTDLPCMGTVLLGGGHDVLWHTVVEPPGRNFVKQPAAGTAWGEISTLCKTIAWQTSPGTASPSFCTEHALPPKPALPMTRLLVRTTQPRCTCFFHRRWQFASLERSCGRAANQSFPRAHKSSPRAPQSPMLNQVEPPKEISSAWW